MWVWMGLCQRARTGGWVSPVKEEAPQKAKQPVRLWKRSRMCLPILQRGGRRCQRQWLSRSAVFLVWMWLGRSRMCVRMRGRLLLRSVWSWAECLERWEAPQKAKQPVQLRRSCCLPILQRGGGKCQRQWLSRSAMFLVRWWLGISQMCVRIRRQLLLRRVWSWACLERW